MTALWEKITAEKPPEFREGRAKLTDEEREVLGNLTRLMAERWDGRDFAVALELKRRDDWAVAVALPSSGIAVASVRIGNVANVKRIWVMREEREVASAAVVAALRGLGK